MGQVDFFPHQLVTSALYKSALIRQLPQPKVQGAVIGPKVVHSFLDLGVDISKSTVNQGEVAGCVSIAHPA